MTEATEEKKKRLIRRRLTVVSIAFALLGAAYIYFSLQVEDTEQDKPPAPVVPIDPAREDLHVGVLAPLQGKLRRYGESIVRGARVAARELNGGEGVLGRNIRLHVADTRSDPALAAELTDDLIRRVGASLIIGTASAQEALAAASVATSGETPFIYLGNGSVMTCSEKDIKLPSEHVWGIGLTSHMTVEPLLIYLADKLRKPETRFRIYYFGTDDPPSRENALFTLRLAESLQFVTEGEQDIDPRIRDYFQEIRKIFRFAPDLLWVTTAKDNSGLFLKQASKIGVQAEMTIAGMYSFEDEIVYPLADSIKEVTTVVRYTESIDREENRKFLKTWKELYPKPEERPTDIAVGGAYTALMAGARAFEKAESTDAAAFREGMKNLEIDVPHGRVVVSAINNLFIQPLYAVTLKDGLFQAEQFLGDVSHPALEACIIESELETEADSYSNEANGSYTQ